MVRPLEREHGPTYRRRTVVAQVIEDRPTADFRVEFESLVQPAKERSRSSRPGYAAGTELVAQCGGVRRPRRAGHRTPTAAAPSGSGPGLARAGLVHRWDAEAGAGIAGAAMDPVVAADAIDEHLDFAVQLTRAISGSPAGPAVRMACTDADQEWYLDLAEAGRHALHPSRSTSADAPRWGRGVAAVECGRLDAERAGLDVEGDRAVLAQWPELVPPEPPGAGRTTSQHAPQYDDARNACG